MTKPQRPSPTTLFRPGMVAWASTWPDWETIAGQESPHPVLAIGQNHAGEIAVLPLSSKPDLGRAQLPITPQEYPSAFTPRGPLSVSPSFICIADRHWALTLRWVGVAPGYLVLPKGRIGLRRITTLDAGDWVRLQRTLSIAVHRARENKP